jgi:hypothetical protein
VPSASADSFLLEQYRTTRIELYQNGNGDEHWKRYDAEEKADHQVETSFCYLGTPQQEMPPHMHRDHANNVPGFCTQVADTLNIRNAEEMRELGSMRSDQRC